MSPLTDIRLPIHNALIYVRNTGDWDVPAIDGIGHLWTSKTCVAVGCLPDIDGATRIIIGDVIDVPRTEHETFDRRIETPSKSVTVESVYDHDLAVVTTGTSSTRVRIWTDGTSLSSIIIVGVHRHD